MYKPKFTKKVIKQFSKLSAQSYERVFRGIILLVLEPSSNALDTEKLTDEDSLFRLRVGDYRIIYTISHDKKEIYIKTISHRKNAY